MRYVLLGIAVLSMAGCGLVGTQQVEHQVHHDEQKVKIEVSHDPQHIDIDVHRHRKRK